MTRDCYSLLLLLLLSLAAAGAERAVPSKNAAAEAPLQRFEREKIPETPFLKHARDHTWFFPFSLSSRLRRSAPPLEIDQGVEDADLDGGEG